MRESDKSACLKRWPEDECCYLGFGFSHSSSLTESPAHSTIRLTSALHISSTLPVPTLIPPPLPQIQHNQCFIWPWLNPFCFHLLEKAWVAILRGAHPINLSCQSWDFSTDVCCSFERRVWAKKESLLSSEKDGKSFCLEKKMRLLTTHHLRQHQVQTLVEISFKSWFLSQTHSSLISMAPCLKHGWTTNQGEDFAQADKSSETAA